MTGPFEVWLRNLWLWAVPLGVCIVGLLGLAIYYSAFDGRVAVLEAQYENRGAELERYRTEATEIADFLGRVEDQRQQVSSLYADHFQTEDERFTRSITEVKRLARNAGLAPTSFSYPTQQENPGLIRRSINFGVDGTYRQLRTFVNFLELSGQFLTLESITLSGSSEGNREPTLSIGLRLATFFVTEEELARESGLDEGGGGSDPVGSEIDDGAEDASNPSTSESAESPGEEEAEE